MNIDSRAATQGDYVFLENVFFTTQRWIIEQLFGWRGDDLERRHLRENHDFERAQIIVVDEQEVGWLIESRLENGIARDGIYILPEFQRRGIGSSVITSIIRDAQLVDSPVRLSVAKVNPARSLYEKLGFKVVDESEFKVFMRRPTGSVSFGSLVFEHLKTLVPFWRVCDEAWLLGNDYLVGIGVERNYGGQLLVVPLPDREPPHPRWPDILPSLESAGIFTRIESSSLSTTGAASGVQLPHL